MNDLPNRFCDAQTAQGFHDTLQGHGIRIERAHTNLEEFGGRLESAYRNLEEFGNQVNKWTIKSDDNAERIDHANRTLAEMTTRLGDITGATLDEMRRNIEALDKKVTSTVLTAGAEKISASSTGIEIAYLNERLASLKREANEYTDSLAKAHELKFGEQLVGGHDRIRCCRGARRIV